MFMPAVFHENLFDDFFDPFWNDGALDPRERGCSPLSDPKEEVETEKS